MNFGFLPSGSNAVVLQASFQNQLSKSYRDMLEQLYHHDSKLFSAALCDSINSLRPSQLNAFYNFAYHWTIKLVGENQFVDASRLLNTLVDGRYQDLPYIVPGAGVEPDLLKNVLREVGGGTSFKAIELFPVTSQLETAAAEKLLIGKTHLRAACPELSAEIDGLVKSVLFFRSGGETRERALSFTGNYVQSMVLINGVLDVSWIFLLDKLVHEAAHTYIFALNLREDMVLNPDDEKYPSPLRRDGRYMAVIYHAVVVIQRLIYAFSSLQSDAQLETEDLIRVEKLLAFYHARLDDGFATVMKHGILSETARGIVCEGQEVAHRLRREIGLESIQARAA